MDPYKIIIKPVTTEATFNLIEDDHENKLVFIVNRKANKHQIKWAIETLYNVKVVKVNTLITPRGEKKAFIKLAPKYKAIDLATKLGLF
ncbi:MAG: 50S ribosomal protein L23 [Candidatus Asgardarchaeia archaeon]